MTRETVCPPGGPRLDPAKVIAAVALHLGSLLAPWTFTREGLALGLTLAGLVGLLGISLGNHRLLAHRSYRVGRPLRYLFAFWGVLAYQAGPLTWCAIHRLHHRHSDRDEDPQMSHHPLLWSHYLWSLLREWPGLATPQDVQRVTRDLQSEPILQFLERRFHAINLAVAAGLFGVGWALGGRPLALSLLVWGFFLRVVAGHHLILLSNSVNHRWGYRNYDTADNSRNCWWVALLSFGEWHNNHHHQAGSAAFGHRWFEIDTSFLLIHALEGMKLASRVVRPRAARKCPAPRPESAHRRGRSLAKRNPPSDNEPHSITARPPREGDRPCAPE